MLKKIDVICFECARLRRLKGIMVFTVLLALSWTLACGPLERDRTREPDPPGGREAIVIPDEMERPEGRHGKREYRAVGRSTMCREMPGAGRCGLSGWVMGERNSIPTLQAPATKVIPLWRSVSGHTGQRSWVWRFLWRSSTSTCSTNWIRRPSREIVSYPITRYIGSPSRWACADDRALTLRTRDGEWMRLPTVDQHHSCRSRGREFPGD